MFLSSCLQYLLFYLGLHYNSNLSFESKSTAEKWTLSNLKKSCAFSQLLTSVGESSIEKSDLQNSLSTSFSDDIPSFKIPSDFPVESASTSCDKSQEVVADFNPKANVLTCLEDSFKKCLMHHPSKLDVQFESSLIGSLQQHSSSGHLEQNMKPNTTLCSADSLSHNISNECKNHSPGIKNHVQSTKSTPTSEGKQGRRKRIAAQFTAPIDD